MKSSAKANYWQPSLGTMVSCSNSHSLASQISVPAVPTEALGFASPCHLWPGGIPSLVPALTTLRPQNSLVTLQQQTEITVIAMGSLWRPWLLWLLSTGTGHRWHQNVCSCIREGQTTPCRCLSVMAARTETLGLGSCLASRCGL